MQCGIRQVSWYNILDTCKDGLYPARKLPVPFPEHGLDGLAL